MMYKIDDTVLNAKSSEDLVAQLHRTSFAPAESDQAFMEEMSKRTLQSTGNRLRTTSAAEFVRDLIDSHMMDYCPIGKVQDWEKVEPNSKVETAA